MKNVPEDALLIIFTKFVPLGILTNLNCLEGSA